MSFIEQGRKPTPTAIKGLEWALALAPFDPSLRWIVAQQMIRDGRFKAAAITLEPLAHTPHPNENPGRTRKLLTQVQTKLAKQDASGDADNSKGAASTERR